MNKQKTRVAVSLLLAFASLGCGEDDENGPSAADKCDMLLDVVCDRYESCATELTGVDAVADFHKKCIDTQRTGIDCTHAVSVSNSYDRCIDELDTFSCNVFLGTDAAGQLKINLPMSCSKAVLLRK